MSKTRFDYIVVVGDSSVELSERVDLAALDGYRPCGGMAVGVEPPMNNVLARNLVLFYQAMARNVEVPDCDVEE